MIFVAVGTQKFQFNRLLREIDTLIEANHIKDTIFAQIGNSDYTPENYSYNAMMSKKDFDEKIAACDLLITHSGVGTIVTGLRLAKPVIVVPRLKRYAEHIDDHQVQIADAFSERNLVLKCEDCKKLLYCIQEAKHHVFDSYVSGNQTVINTIETYLDKLR